MGILREITYEYLGSLKYTKEIKRNIEIPIARDIVAIIGPRRVGKTFLMLKKAKELLDEEKQVIYVSFDEPNFRDMAVRKFAELVRMEYPESPVFIFLDEIQEWKNWDFNLRWLHDVKDFYIYISGSSSILQSSEIPSRLRGRYVSKLILPISFKEIVNFEIKTFRERGRVLRLLEEYLKWGGFPEVWLEKSREKIVSILETVFYRDVIERQRIRDLQEFKEFFYFVISNFANNYTYNSLKKVMEGYGIKIDTKTIIKYINSVKSSFLIFEICRFTYSEKEKIRSQKKLYLVDLCFSNLFEKGLEKGRKIENLVFTELSRRCGEVFYYITKSGKEIDFYVPNKKILVEVSLDSDEEHIKKMKEAMKELKVREGTIITWDYEDEREIKWFGRKGKIKFLPLWRWLLG